MSSTTTALSVVGAVAPVPRVLPGERVPWVPLMAGGGESAIIAQWLQEAERRFTEERDGADLGTLTRVFATLAGCRPAWDHALRGWNMKTSPIFDEVRVEVEKLT